MHLNRINITHLVNVHLSTIVEDVAEICNKEYLSQGQVRSGHKYPLKTTEHIENVHKKRIERVHDVCEKYQKSSHVYSLRPKIGDSFVFDVNNGFAWCYVPKVTIKYKSSPGSQLH